MKHLPEWPAPLLRKWLLSAVIGLGFLIVGSIMYVALNDKIMLLLSIPLTLLSTGPVKIYAQNCLQAPAE